MSRPNIKQIAITTGGGDAPGLHAVIRTVVLSAIGRVWRYLGIREGYNGLLEPDDYPEGGVIEITRDSVKRITHMGEAILGTTNRGNPVCYPVKGEDGVVREVDRTEELVEAFGRHEIDAVVAKKVGREERLGGIGEKVAAELSALTSKETRAVVLGHLLRGGSPTTFGRLISLCFGAAAVRALEEGQEGVMVALDPPTVRYVPLRDVVRGLKVVPLDSDTVTTARDLGISFGE